MKKKEIPLFENFKALGTVWGVLFFEEIESLLREEMEKDIKEIILAFEKAYSRFEERSLVGTLNRHGEVAYDEDLKKMLILGDSYGELSEGIFSLFIKKDLTKKGYGEEWKIKTVSSSDKKWWGNDGQKIFLHNENGLDLGGIGKGYLIDMLTRTLREKYKISSFIINGGGDIYVASSLGPIEIFLEHPLAALQTFGSIFLENESLCCSSSFKRAWSHGGKERNHFISAGGEVWGASFVVGDSAVGADVFATLLCILTQTPKKLERIMKGNTDVEFLVVGENGEVYKTKRFEGVL